MDDFSSDPVNNKIRDQYGWQMPFNPSTQETETEGSHTLGLHGPQRPFPKTIDKQTNKEMNIRAFLILGWGVPG